jgi:cytochrome P450
MDPPEHTEYRRINDRYFTPELMSAFEPSCRQIAANLVDALPRNRAVELMSEFAQLYALRVQSTFLGWPGELEVPLQRWIRANHDATLARDAEAMAEVALTFDTYIRDLLTVRRDAGDAAPDDLTTRLLSERVWDRPMTDAELVSLLRNWTVGELGTIAASVGILAHQLARAPALQQKLRDDPRLIRGANEEMLRIHAPLIANRRITTCPVDLGDRHLKPHERVTLIWASANRDETVFDAPDEFRLDRDQSHNLLYGAGIHVCPGAPLARLQLSVVVEELLGRTRHLKVAAEGASRAIYPGSGFDLLHLLIS